METVSQLEIWPHVVLEVLNNSRLLGIDCDCKIMLNLDNYYTNNDRHMKVFTIPASVPALHVKKVMNFICTGCIDVSPLEFDTVLQVAMDFNVAALTNFMLHNSQHAYVQSPSNVTNYVESSMSSNIVANDNSLLNREIKCEVTTRENSPATSDDLQSSTLSGSESNIRSSNLSDSDTTTKIYSERITY